MSSRAAPLAWLPLLAAALVFAAWESPAQASGPRPFDAPRPATGTVAEVPPLPPLYLQIDEAGIGFSYHPSARERIRPLLEHASSIRDALSAAVGTSVLEHVEVRVAAVPSEMVRLAPGDVPADATTVAFHDARLVVMSVVSNESSSPLDLEAALTHGLAHLALDEAVSAVDVPLWFHEGFALHASEGGGFSQTRVLVGAASFGRLRSLGDLHAHPSADALADAQAGDFVRFLAASRSSESGMSGLARLLRKLKDGEPFEPALAQAMDAPDRAQVEQAWRAAAVRRYAVVPMVASVLAVVALLSGLWLWASRKRHRVAAKLEAVARARRDLRVPGKPRRVSGKLAAAARVVAGRGKDAAIHVIREPEVPKVEHDGEWHTLH